MFAVETFIKNIYLMIGVMRSLIQFRINCIETVWTSKERNVKSIDIFSVSVFT